MFIFSYGNWLKSAKDANAMPVINIPTDYENEGYIGSNSVDNSWLVIAGPEQKTGNFGVFGIDKSIVRGETVGEIHREVCKLWQIDRNAFIYQYFLSAMYNLYIKGEDILHFLEKFFEEQDSTHRKSSKK